MTRTLPSLKALRSFEAAARHLSLARAADELHVTPGAVGQQVKSLESHLGVQLFHRLPQGLHLTEAGAALLPGLGEGFERLASAVEEARLTDTRRGLVVSIAPTLAGKWLVPRLYRFAEAHGDIEVRIDATDRPVDLLHEEVDVAIRLSPHDHPDLHTDLLFDEEVFPVCSPALLEQAPPLEDPSDLQRHTLLHVDWKYPTDAWVDWPKWLKAAGVEAQVDPVGGPRFSLFTMAIQSAIEGHGVALTGSVFVADDLAAGRLVKPFALSVPTDCAYCLLCAPASAHNPKIETFRAWLLEEARATRPRGQGRGPR